MFGILLSYNLVPVIDVDPYFNAMNSGAESFNGLIAMIGIVAGIGTYATSDQLIPGIF